MTTRFIECQIMTVDDTNSSLGVESTQAWTRALVDLATVFHLWENPKYENVTNFCDDVGETMFVVRIPYEQAKKILLDYRNTLIGERMN